MKKNQINYKELIKILFLIFLGMVSFQNGFAQIHNGQSQTDIDYGYIPPSPVDSNLYIVAEVKPEFPGNINKYIYDNAIYPKGYKGATGNVVWISFIIERDGSVTNAAILRSSDTTLNMEAIQVVSSMPKWLPAKQDGKAVRVRYWVPIRFHSSSASTGGTIEK